MSPCPSKQSGVSAQPLRAFGRQGGRVAVHVGLMPPSHLAAGAGAGEAILLAARRRPLLQVPHQREVGLRQLLACTQVFRVLSI